HRAAWGCNVARMGHSCAPTKMASRREAILVGTKLLLAGVAVRQGQVYYLGYLPPGGVVAGAVLQAAWAAGVAGDDAVAVGRLYNLEERGAHRHVGKRGRRGVLQRPPGGQHHYLGQLRPRSEEHTSELQ